MRVFGVVMFAWIMVGCAGDEKSTSPQKQPAAAQYGQTTEEIATPAGAGAAEPFLFATHDSILLSWLEPVAGTDRVALRFARYRGGQWSTPRTIVERNDLFVNWADFPSIVEDTHGALFAHWLQKSGAGTYAYDVRMSASTDDGATWREPFLLNRDGKQREHGFATLAPLPRGGIGATWLDGRAMKSGGGHEEDSGDMAVRYAKVDANGTIADDVQLDDRTCECCTTGMTMTEEGPVIVYRDRSPDEIRDISYVRRTATGWTKPQPLNTDAWKIAGCPVNGPQIDAIGRHAVAAAWFTAAQEKGHALVAFSDDGGTTFTQPVQIDDGKPIGRLDVVLLDERTALATWLEQTPTGGEIRARKIRRDGMEPSIKIADSSTARAAGFTRIARMGRDVYFTWTEHDGTKKRIHLSRRRFP